ncbi:YopX family protein (plasmid) [Jeotgalibaca sp. MA1X17-3]|uniref:YopX family protein n=1 Tax=Jeotgalibaca sp. MA1X17-3 TaxID=2908211 RepID=UPI001F245635|nr:YopX family protein [Jeotgalibaca sp. MA1X17-3]UJF16748.1 YopX family protein [Jeotgalibaca sp. MA1X17-3]
MREIEFRVFDLYEGKVLYGDQIPKKGVGLLESIRQLSGNSYELSQYTEIADLEGKKIYEGDIVEVLDIKIINYEIHNNILGEGIVKYISGIPTVTFTNKGEIYTFSLNDREHEFRVTGNRLENKSFR